VKADEAIADFLTTTDAVVKAEKLPSGTVWLSVWKGTDFFTIECTKDGPIGISRGRDNDGFMGHDESFSDVKGALEYLKLAFDRG
jgi:hypothetical protein